MIDEKTFTERAAEALALKQAEQDEISQEQTRDENNHLKAKIANMLGIEVEPEDGEWCMAGLRFYLCLNGLMAAPVELLENWSHDRTIQNWADVGWVLNLIDKLAQEEATEPTWYCYLTVAEMNAQRAAGRSFAVVSMDHENDAALVEYLDVAIDDDVAVGWDGAVAACREERVALLAQLADVRGQLEITRARLIAALGGEDAAHMVAGLVEIVHTMQAACQAACDFFTSIHYDPLANQLRAAIDLARGRLHSEDGRETR